MAVRRRAGRAKAAAKPKKSSLSRTSALGRRMADAMRNRGVGGPLPRRPRGENPERGDTPSKNPRLPKGRKKLPIPVGELPPGPTRGQGDPRKDPNRPKPQTKPDLGEMEKVLKKFGKARKKAIEDAEKLPKPPRRRRPGPITSPGEKQKQEGPIQKPKRRKRPGPITSPGGKLPVPPRQGKPMPPRKFVGEPVTPPGGKPPMKKPMPVMPGPVVGKPVPAPPPGSNPPMPGIKPKPPGGFKKGGTVGGAKKKGKAKIRGAGIERKGLRKAKMR